MNLTSNLKNSTGLFSVLALALLLVIGTALTAAAQTRTRRAPAAAPAKVQVVKTYSCVMHPEVKAHKHGKCPKCGMELRLDRTAASVTNVATPAAPAAAPEPAGEVPPLGASVTTRMSIPDVAVLDQDGNELHFYTDLVKGKTVAINFIFTNCTTICPPLAATFARVQKELGDRVGRDVHFISISVDPLTDTPERLKNWGAKFRAGKGWTFVTGDKQEMEKLLSALGASVARREDHSPTVLVGNDVKGVWTRTYGLARSSQMVGLIMNVMAGKTDTGPSEESAQP